MGLGLGLGLGLEMMFFNVFRVFFDVFRVEKYSARKILGLGLGLGFERSRVSEGVVSVSNGQVSVSVLVSDDEVSVLVLVSNDEAETPSLLSTRKNKPLRSSVNNASLACMHDICMCMVCVTHAYSNK